MTAEPNEVMEAALVFYPKVRGIARKFAGHEDCEDITQEVYLKVARKADQLENFDSLESWISRITVRECFQFHRRAAHRIKTVPLFIAGPECGGIVENCDFSFDICDVTAEARIITAIELKEALGFLSREIRLLLLLHDRYGYSIQEMAGIMGLNYSTIRVHMHRAQKSLREFFNGNRCAARPLLRAYRRSRRVRQ